MPPTGAPRCRPDSPWAASELQTHETTGQAASPPPRERKDLPVQAIPEELRHQRRWVCWDRTPRDDGRPSKAPINPRTGENASVSDPATWASFDEAVACAKANVRMGGVGFVLTDSDCWSLDLDHVISDDGEVSPSVLRFIDSLTPTYIERSPSGHGLHIIFRGERPAQLSRTKVQDAFGPGMNLEIFGGGSARYITVTGNVWIPDATGSHHIAEAAAADVDAILALFPAEPRAEPKPAGGIAPLPIGNEMAKATFALRNVPSDDYHDWIHVGMALHSAFGDAGMPAWTEWSKKSAKFEEAAIDQHWRSFKDRQGGKTIAFVYWLADRAWPHWRQEMREEEGTMQSARSDVVATPTSATRRGLSPKDVLDSWDRHGPLIHVPTGIRSFDEMTGGGPVFGTRFYLLGAPDAGKTAVLVQILDEMLLAGLAVGVLAVDEEPEDMLQRFLQRRGWKRSQCEERRPGVITDMRAAVEGLSLTFYDSTFSIEAAAKELAEVARIKGLRAAFGVDSIQTASSSVETEDGSRYETVSARVKAIRQVATEFDLITIATSEMSRNAYRSMNAGDRTNEMAAAKESGAIEYSARIAAALKLVEGAQDLIELRIFKNKHGRTHAQKEQGIYLRLDKASQLLVEEADHIPHTEDAAASARTAKRDAETTQDAARVAVTVAKNRGVAAKKCEELVSGATPGRMGHARLSAARGRLGSSLVEIAGKGTTKHLYIDGSKLPVFVLAAIPEVDRSDVISSRPPAQTAFSTDPPSPAPSRTEAPQGGSSTPLMGGAPPPLIGGGGTSLGAGGETLSDEVGALRAALAWTSDRAPAPNADTGMPEKPQRRRKAKTRGGA